MLNKQWAHLKSGTDIRGVAFCDDESKLDLTDDAVYAIAGAFAKWLGAKCGKTDLTVALGHDSRVSAPRIKKAVISALTECGVKVYDCGLSSTPSMFMATITDIACDGSIEITASHHPSDKNGLKFFTKDSGLEGEDITALLEYAQAGEKLESDKEGEVVKYDFMAVYAKHLRDIICKEVNAESYEKPLEGLKIIVDAGNGVGGFYVKDVLEVLGADCSGSQFLDPDGMFPNHIPNPENKEAMDSACSATLANNADLGIIFDTDVDRMGCVDKNGNEINRNRLIALASVIALENCSGGTIVTDSLTSDGLRKFIEKDLGAKQLRFKRGYKNVINKSIELNNEGIESPLAIETSGHAALKENYFLDDGAYLATKIVVKLAQLSKQGKKLEDLIGTLEEPVEEEEIRFKINLEDFKEYGEKVLADLADFSKNIDGWEIEKVNYEGVRINFPQGWLLLRLSVHDPILPLNIETNESGKAIEVINILKQFFVKYDMLDLTNLNKYN